MPSTISYDPMSRTYKLMFLQNQLAHARNKQKVHSVGISNIIPYKGRPTSTINKSSSMRHSTSSLKGSDKNSTLNSMGASFCFIDQHRLIHHNA